MDTEAKTYGLYVRVSTEEQASVKEDSITSQLQQLKEY
jgi:DNA invertase Pin-like site-specific DNA recombinase